MSTCIWYVSKYVAPPGSGTAGGRGYLLMKELARMGHKVVIITSDSNQLAAPPQLEAGYQLQDVDGLQLWWVRTHKYRVAKSMPRIVSWLHFEWRLLWLPKKRFPKPDVVVVSSLSLLTILNGLWWKVRYKCRLIFEIRDIWPLTITEEGGFKPSNPFVWGLGVVERIGYKYADAIVGTMPNLGEHVSNVLGYPRPTHFIPMGVDAGMFATPAALPHGYEEFFFPKHKFIVAHVGSIGITNALDTFFECAETLQSDPVIHFLVVGDGDLREMYRARYAHLTNLTFGPRVAKDMVQTVLAKCDLLYFSVHVSKVWQYGQSLNKVIDYMMAGKPVVASYSGYPSMINEAECGSYVPANDVYALKQEVLRYSMMSVAERERIGQKGKKWLFANRQYPKLAADYLRIMNGIGSTDLSSNHREESNPIKVNTGQSGRPLRQVWILNHYAQEPGGTGSTRHFGLARHLFGLGWHATVIAASVEHGTGRQRLASDEKTRIQSFDGVSFLWVKTPHYKGNGVDRILNILSYTFRVLLPGYTVDLPRPDVIVGSSVHPFAAVAGALLAKRHGVPFVFEVRDLWPQTLVVLGRLKETSLMTRVLQWVELWLYRRADRIVVLPSKAVDYIEPLGISSDKVVCIPNGVELSAYVKQTPTVFQDVFTLMYFGSHGQTNCLNCVLDAMAVLRALPGMEHVRLRMIGDGPLKSALMAQASQLNLSNVEFEESVPKAQIPKLASEADAFVICVKDLPQLYKYGVSMNKLFDYMAASRPIIMASAAANNPVDDAGAGITVAAENSNEMAKAIHKLVNLSQEQRTAMGEAGRAYVEKHHSYKALASKYADLFQQIEKINK